ncbi:MAG: hypothetical protein KBC96_08680 [Armatimonadetes bacterium]|nr:hypothetical protein [Armatimonadota bacterium]
MRVRSLSLSIMAVLIGTCCVQSTAKSKIDTVVYEVKLSSPQGDMGTRKMYRRGDHFLWEYESAGMKMKFVRNKDGAFMIHPTGRYAGKYPPGSNRENPITFLPGPQGDVKEFLNRQRAERVGEEKVEGRICDIYTYIESESQWKCKLWVDKKDFVPVKMTMTGAKKTDVIDVIYLSYKTGVVVAESRFDLPKDIEIRNVPEPKKDSEAADKSEKPDAAARDETATKE